MLNLIQKFLKIDRTPKSEVRKNFSTYFFSQPEHAWITQKNLAAPFKTLIEKLPVGVLECLMTKYPLSFITHAVYRSRTATHMHLSNTVVVFPEFEKLLATGKGSAVAYLAHEVAFLLLELEEGQRETLMAEVEADKFVSDLGLTFELEELLLMLDETVEKRLRLTYLTINHFSSAN